MQLSPIITIEELLKIHNNKEVLLFDASNGKDAKANYKAQHIQGAFFIDLNSQLANIPSDFSKGGRHPLPEIAVFAEILTDFGVYKHTHVIIYDDKNGANAAARFWWMLKAVGHEKVQVLDGGINLAREKDFPLSSKLEVIKKAAEPYEISNWHLPTIEMEELETIAKNSNYLVVDVRDKNRYNGISEPIDLVAGHIPGAINIPLTENLDKNGFFLSPKELKDKYEAKFGKIKSENIVVHCGSGVTACHTLLALDYAGIQIPKLYVGSWSEWSRNDKEIAKSGV